MLWDKVSKNELLFKKQSMFSFSNNKNLYLPKLVQKWPYFGVCLGVFLNYYFAIISHRERDVRKTNLKISNWIVEFSLKKR